MSTSHAETAADFPQSEHGIVNEQLVRAIVNVDKLHQDILDLKDQELKLIPNPFLRHPANVPCMCGSRAKFRRCCKTKFLKLNFTAEEAAPINKYLKAKFGV